MPINSIQIYAEYQGICSSLDWSLEILDFSILLTQENQIPLLNEINPSKKRPHKNVPGEKIQASNDITKRNI